MFTDIQIAPSILSADFANLERDVRMVSEAGADWIHVDVMDGHFVPNLTIGPAHVKMLKRVTDVPLDVHLMIDNPEVQVPWYIDAGADSVTVHVEACDDAATMLRMIGDAGVKVGISLNPETDASALEGLLGLVDMVLVMQRASRLWRPVLHRELTCQDRGNCRDVQGRRRRSAHRGRWGYRCWHGSARECRRS